MQDTTYFRLIAHEPFRDGVHGVEYQELSDTCAPVTLRDVREQAPAHIPDVPEPRMRAAADSLPFTLNDGDMVEYCE